MFRFAVLTLILALDLLSFLVPAAAQTPPATTEPAAQTAGPAKPAAKKATTKPKAIARPAEPTTTGPCEIGVIPIAGDLFTVEKFGPVKFLDKYTRTSVAAWALDDLVVSRVRAAALGISVRRIPYSLEELRSGGRQKQNPWFYRPEADVKGFVQFLAPKIRCDRYLVVHRHGGTQREYGIGISQYPYGGPVHLFAMMLIRIYDGRTFELIKEAPALMTEDTYIDRMTHNFLGGPSMKLDSAMFPEKPADVVNTTVLRDGVRTMLTKSLDKTLPALLQRPTSPSSR